MEGLYGAGRADCNQAANSYTAQHYSQPDHRAAATAFKKFASWSKKTGVFSKRTRSSNACFRKRTVICRDGPSRTIPATVIATSSGDDQTVTISIVYGRRLTPRSSAPATINYSTSASRPSLS
ncbi:hypothetical protein BDZ89DRAFT_805970 [Hymenopellis radicata]|nr:hypothetical protein BDZ89DRAFT_805970 [Hymenopellis radicata]